METSNLPDKKYQAMVIKALSTVKRRTGGLQYRNRKYKRYQTEVTELKNTVTVLKGTLKGFNSRPDDAGENDPGNW